MKDIKAIRLDNVKGLMQEQNLYDSREEFASKFNMSYNMFSQYFSTSKSRKTIGDKVARRIEQAYEKPHGWLDTPRYGSSSGQPLESIEKEKVIIWDENTVLSDDLIPIDFKKNVIFQSGAGGAIVPDNEGRKLMMSARTLKAHNVDAKNVFATTNQGDSNAGEILSGDTIWVDQSKKKIVADEFYAINHAGSLRVKMLDKIGDQLRVRSYSDDKATYPDEYYKVDELLENEIHIIGWVFSWQRIRRWRW